MSYLQATMILALLATGLGAALLGSVKVHLAARLRIDEARIGGLVSLFGFTLVPVIFTAGFLTDLVGRQVVLVGGSLLLAASLGLLAVARSYVAALVAVIVLSAGWALVINVGNVLTPLAFGGNSLAYATNLANVFFGLGAFLTPLAAAVLIRRLGFPPALYVLAAFCLLPGLLALSIDSSSLASAASAGAGEIASADPAALFRDPFLWLCGFALFFYGPLEASVGAWATTYLGEQGYREPAAAGLLSAFWLTFMAARLITAFWLPADCEHLLIVALSIACIAVLSGMVFGRGRAAGAIMVVAAGAVFGPIFPTLVAIFLGHFAAELHGRAVGMLFAIGGIGWAVIPMLIGTAARRQGVRRGFSVAIAAAVGLTAVTSAIGMMK
ncbi:MAG TPA: MFS transporter [Pirellulales bacterium]|jgi:fucose permease|nr:MFS transporter [Pirellulales bacterium]